MPSDRAIAFTTGVALGVALGALAAPSSARAVREVLARTRARSERERKRRDVEAKDALIARLGLIPHPEGGFFVETYRTGCEPMSSRGKTATDAGQAEATCDTARRTERGDDGRRNHMTSIYYVLTRESDHQWWALNASDHVHYHHAGGSVTYHLAREDGTYERRVLGRDVEGGQTPQLVVRGGTFKAAVLEPGAEYAIIGEAVSPGFDFRDFRFVRAGELAARNAACFDDASHLIKPAPEDTFDHYYNDASATPPQEYFTPTREQT